VRNTCMSPAELMRNEIIFMDQEKELRRKSKKNTRLKRFEIYFSGSEKKSGLIFSANPAFNEHGTCKGALLVTGVTEKVQWQQQLLNERINKQRGAYGAYYFCNKTNKRYFQE